MGTNSVVVTRVHCFFKNFISELTEHSLQKHAYSNMLKILSPKNENFQIKNSDIFHISAQNIIYGCSLELPQ